MRVRPDYVRGRCVYLVVDLAPALVLEIVMLESLQTVNTDVEICCVKNYNHCELTLRCMTIRSSITYGLQL